MVEAGGRKIALARRRFRRLLTSCMSKTTVLRLIMIAVFGL